MTGRPSRGVSVIDFRFKPDVKPHAAVISSGNIFQNEIRPVFAQADVGKPVRLPDPNPVIAPQRNVRRKKIQPRDGDPLSVGGSIFKRVKNQRRVVEA